MNRAKAKALALAFSLFALSSCTALPSLFLEPTERAARVAAEHGWRRADIAVPGFRLAAWERYRGGSDLAVYIESDGYNWATRYQPSADPTPLTPRVLELAVQDPSPNRLYVARPCQYLPDSELARCSAEYWLRGRYASEVVAALDRAIDEGKRRSGAESVTLFGYSGGGSLAVLVAARRTDVRQVVTIVANLDHKDWTKHHGVTPLTRSLNAADVADAIAKLPQIHFVGTEDDIVPRAVTDSYMRRLGTAPSARVIALKFDHTCCWVRDWSDLLKRYVYPG